MNTKELLHASGLPKVARESHLALLELEGKVRGRRTPRDRDRPLRILGYTPSYLPDNRAGSEITLHRVLRELSDRGASVRVLVDGAGTSGSIDGIDVVADDRRAKARELVAWSDVVVAQLSTRGRALRLTARLGKPLVFYMQLGNTPRNVLWGSPDLTVFSSQYVRDDFPWIEPALVLHPPIDEADYLCTPGRAVTMINLSRLKGGHGLPELATRMPNRQFLAVRGWGAQQVPDPLPANVVLLEGQDDMRCVYGRTRVLLVPSIYETYGRVCLEAAVSGIPTIAHPSGGVREALGDAAIWVDRDDTDGWVDALAQLDDPDTYADYSRRARARFDALDPGAELDALADALDRVVDRPR